LTRAVEASKGRMLLALIAHTGGKEPTGKQCLQKYFLKHCRPAWDREKRLWVEGVLFSEVFGLCQNEWKLKRMCNYVLQLIRRGRASGEEESEEEEDEEQGENKEEQDEEEREKEMFEGKPFAG
jgi:hypothetical protein